LWLPALRPAVDVPRAIGLVAAPDDSVSVQVLGDDLRRFLASAIGSVPHLEALLLIREASAPGVRIWSPTAVAGRLYLPEAQVHTILGELSDHGLLMQSSENPPRYGYSPRTVELEKVVSKLAEAYRSHLIEVTEFIHSKSGRKAQRFADAFRWRKE
jgi:hypothetical protein